MKSYNVPNYIIDKNDLEDVTSRLPDHGDSYDMYTRD